MRLLIFSAQYPPTIGGVERYTNSLATELVREGHRVTVVASRLPDTPWREVSEGVEVLRVPSWLPLAGRLPVPRFDRQFRAILRGVWRRPYDMALINTRFWPLSIWAARACRRRGVPAIVLEHGSGYLSLGGATIDVCVHVYERIGLWLVRQWQRRFYAVSRLSAEWLSGLGVRAQGVLPNAIDVDEVRDAVAGSGFDLRALLGLDHDQLVIGYAGRLIPEKGLRELLAAMPQVLRCHGKAVLAIVGDGPMRDEVEAARDASMRYLGSLDHGDTMAFLSQVDVVCLPSYSEGFATVVLESAAVGTPVVATRVGGAIDVIEDDRHGLLLDDHRPETIAAGLGRALDDPLWRREAGQRAQDRVADQFTWAATASRVVAAASHEIRRCGDTA